MTAIDRDAVRSEVELALAELHQGAHRDPDRRLSSLEIFYLADRLAGLFAIDVDIDGLLKDGRASAAVFCEHVLRQT